MEKQPEPLIQEAVGKSNITNEQWGNLHAWDIFIEDIGEQLMKEKVNYHIYNPRDVVVK